MFFNGFFEDVKKSLTNIGDHPLISLCVASLDAFLIFFSSFVLSSLFRSVFDEVVLIMNFFMGQMKGMPSDELLELVPSEAALYAMYFDIFSKASLFFLMIIVVWGITQSTAWHLIYRISEKKKGPHLFNYMKRFFIISLIFGSVYYLSLMLFSFMVLRISSVFHGVMIGIYSVIIAIIVIIMHTSYSLIFRKKKFKHYFSIMKKLIFSKKFFGIFFVFLSAALALLVSSWIQATLVIFPGVMLLVGFLLDFGIFIMLRLVLLRTVERLSAKL